MQKQKIVPNKKWGHRAKLIFHWKNYKHPQRTSQLVLLNLYVFLQNFIGIWAVSCITEKSITFEMKEIFSSNLLIEIDPSCKKLIWILSRCELIIFLEKYWYISGQIVHQNLSGADESGSEILRQQTILSPITSPVYWKLGNVLYEIYIHIPVILGVVEKS